MILEDYLKLPYALIIIPDEEGEGYVAFYPELKGCVTCSSDAANIVTMAEDAKMSWIETAVKAGINIPKPEKYKVA